MNKDVNLKLILMMIILVLSIVSFAIFFQKKFTDISSGYENKTQELEKITAKAVLEESKVQEISLEQERLLQDKETLEKGYMAMKEENQELEGELASLGLEVQNAKSELQEKTSEFSLLQTRFNQMEGSLIKANDEISRLVARVRELCDDLEDAGGSNEDC